MAKFREPQPALSLRMYMRFGLRNLTRNPRRTFLSLLSLIIGTSAVTYLGAVNDGWLIGMRDNFIMTYTSHIQIQSAGHHHNRRISDFISKPDEVTALLAHDNRIAAWSYRIRADGFASIGSVSAGVQVFGVDIETEGKVSRMADLITDHRCLHDKQDKALVLGEQVAKTLNAKPGDKVVLMSEQANGELTSELFELCGTIKTGAPHIDRFFAMIPLQTAQKWLGLGDAVTQIAIRVREHDMTEPLMADLRSHLPASRFQLLAWYDLDPMVWQWLRFGEVYGYIILGIVFGLTITQVSNTMIMAFHERIPEFGLMEALGTRRRQLFFMVAMETLILIIVGGVLGWLTGAAAINFSAGGINLSHFAGAFEFFFMDPVIRPVVTWTMAVKVVIALSLAAIIGGLYPAWMSAKLDPIEAMR